MTRTTRNRKPSGRYGSHAIDDIYRRSIEMRDKYSDSSRKLGYPSIDRYVGKTDDEVYEEAKVEHSEWFRDGMFYETGRSRYYKRLCKRDLRSHSREMINKILKGEEYDKYCPNNKRGKRFIWSVW